MNFISIVFVIFVAAVFGLYVLIPARLRMPLLLAASYVFYGTWSVPFVGIILVTTTVDYLAGRVISQSASTARRKTALIGAITLNLLILITFKYLNFLLSVQQSLMQWLGVTTTAPTHLDIILPLGISYYTFEAISYVVDVYRGSQPAKNWLDYNFYIMYFPHLIAGPIVRYNQLSPQYSRPMQAPSAERFFRGLELIVLGYMFRLIIADNCALVADPLFADARHASVALTYAGALAYGTQLYFDFLGYVQIARGVSLLFNIELPSNFNHPLLANNVANFWQRWQLTLTRWLHDYLFIPLGGARKSLPRTMLSVVIVFFVAGVWHGAGWTFVALGLYVGVVGALYHLYRRMRPVLLGDMEKKVTGNQVYRVISVAAILPYYLVGATLFRAPDLQTALTIFDHLTRFRNLAHEISAASANGHYMSLAYMLLFPAVLFGGETCVRLYDRFVRPMPYWLKLQGATTACACCWIFAGERVQPFIYFQF